MFTSSRNNKTHHPFQHHREILTQTTLSLSLSVDPGEASANKQPFDADLNIYRKREIERSVHPLNSPLPSAPPSADARFAKIGTRETERDLFSLPPPISRGERVNGMEINATTSSAVLKAGRDDPFDVSISLLCSPAFFSLFRHLVARARAPAYRRAVKDRNYQAF